MQPGCLIKLAGQQPVLRKGKMEPIKLNVVQRGSQKKVCVVSSFLVMTVSFSKLNLIHWRRNY